VDCGQEDACRAGRQLIGDDTSDSPRRRGGAEAARRKIAEIAKIWLLPKLIAAPAISGDVWQFWQFWQM
jgi:hypothetical protein